MVSIPSTRPETGRSCPMGLLRFAHVAWATRRSPRSRSRRGYETGSNLARQTMAILWDSLVGVFGAILLLGLLSFLVTALVGFYQTLLKKYLEPRMRRPDLIPALSRFAAVASIALWPHRPFSLRVAAGPRAGTGRERVYLSGVPDAGRRQDQVTCRAVCACRPYGFCGQRYPALRNG